ncbi:hypothetical protein HUJ04_002665 [Dendroctonus ponderosae]|nr:hypothetical protein HUJ04_002665 [Dendroctonus ponderosae]
MEFHTTCYHQVHRPLLTAEDNKISFPCTYMSVIRRNSHVDLKILIVTRVKSCSEVHPPNKSTFIDDLIIISKIRAGNLLQDDWPMILILRKYSKALSEQCRNALQIYTFPLAHQLPQVELNNLLI